MASELSALLLDGIKPSLMLKPQSIFPKRLCSPQKQSLGRVQPWDLGGRADYVEGHLNELSSQSTISSCLLLLWGQAGWYCWISWKQGTHQLWSHHKL